MDRVFKFRDLIINYIQECPYLMLEKNYYAPLFESILNEPSAFSPDDI